MKKRFRKHLIIRAKKIDDVLLLYYEKKQNI
jgi:hypothetical protein